MIKPHHALLGTIGFAGIILYGSLVPFQFEPRPFTEALDQFVTICEQPLHIRSRSDFLANILLFIPLSFLLLGTLQLSFPKHHHLFYLPVIVVCISYGALIEFLQLFFPPRSTALNDIVAQSIGSTVGVLVWLLAGQKIVIFSNLQTNLWQGRNRFFPFLLLYLLLVVILNSVPFDFTISPVEVVHKYREGRINWIPLQTLEHADQNLLQKWLWHAIVFMPIGILLGMGKTRSVVTIAPWSFLFALCIELLQMFVISRNVDTSDVLIGGLAVLAGWGITRLYQLQQNRMALHVALTLWIMAAMLINWSPFNFTTENVSSQWARVTFIPLLDYQSKNYLSAFDDIAHKSIFFMLFGTLISMLSRSAIRSSLAFFISGVASAIIEVGQLFVPGRTPSVSDILLGAGAGAAGCWLASSTSKQGTLS